MSFPWVAPYIDPEIRPTTPPKPPTNAADAPRLHIAKQPQPDVEFCSVYIDPPIRAPMSAPTPAPRNPFVSALVPLFWPRLTRTDFTSAKATDASSRSETERNATEVGAYKRESFLITI